MYPVFCRVKERREGGDAISSRSFSAGFYPPQHIAINATPLMFLKGAVASASSERIHSHSVFMLSMSYATKRDRTASVRRAGIEPATFAGVATLPALPLPLGYRRIQFGCRHTLT